MLRETREIQNWIKNKYKGRYTVKVEIDQINRLALGKGIKGWYQPDTILLRNGDIAYIIEIEVDPMRKSIVGAAILANQAVRTSGQSTKPKLIFVVHGKAGLRQMKDFKERVKVAKIYCPDLSDISIFTEEEFKKLDL